MKAMIKDKYIPVTLGLISLVCFISGSLLMIFAIDIGINLVPGFTLMAISPISALAGSINGIIQIAKRKSTGLVNFGTILSGIEFCIFAYAVFMLAFFG